MKKIILSASLLTASFALAQNTGIGTTKPDASAQMEVASATKGVLIPRVALTAINAATPVTAPAVGLTVFNTAAAGTAPNNVTQGYYYWDGAKWVRIVNSADLSAMNATEPWYNEATNTPATANNQNIYQSGDVTLAGPGTPTGAGKQMFFGNRNDNTDPISIYRYNNASDKTDLRVQIGDNAEADDKFIVGTSANGTFKPLMTVDNTGLARTEGSYLVVKGGGNEQAYIGGDGAANDVQVGSTNSAVNDLSLFNASSGKYMNLVAKDITGNGNSYISGNSGVHGNLAVDGTTYLATVAAGATSDNVLVRGTDGVVKQVTAADFAAANSKNIYNINGTLTDVRTVDQNGKSITFKNGDFVAGKSVLTNDGQLELGNGMQGDRNSFIDFHSSDNVDYSTRLYRTPGTGGQFVIENTGGANVQINNSAFIKYNLGVGGYDFSLGSNNQTDRGNSGSSRALVKSGDASGSQLYVNFGNDFTAGTRVDSKLFVSNTTGAADSANDKVLTIDTNGEVKNSGSTLSQIASSTEPWYVAGTTTPATANNQNIYQSGNIGIGLNSPTSPLHVLGSATPVAQFQSTVADAAIRIIPNGNMNGRFAILTNDTNKLTSLYGFNEGNAVGAITIKHDTGNIGIGGAPGTARMTVSGGIADISYGPTGSNTLPRDNAGLQGDAGARSGFYETSQAEAAGSNYPTGANGWWHLIDTRHSNNSNNFAMQLAGGFYDQNLWFRKTSNNAAQPWSKVLTQNQSTGALSIFNNLPVGNAGNNVLTMDSAGNVYQVPSSSITSANGWGLNGNDTNGAVNWAGTISQTPFRLGAGNDIKLTINTDNTVKANGSIYASQNNQSGGGFYLGDDGSIVDNNDGAATFRFGTGIKITNGTNQNTVTSTIDQAGNATFNGNQTTGGATNTGYLTVRPQDAAGVEGGEIQLQGSNGKNTFQIDNLGGQARIFGQTQLVINSQAVIADVPDGANTDQVVVRDANGLLKKISAAELVSSNNQNIYNADGTVTSPRSVNMNGKNITWAGGEQVYTNTNAFRLVAGNQGMIFRNDGGAFYMLPSTDSNGLGSWTSARPFIFNFSTNNVTLADGAQGNVGIGISPGFKLDVNGNTTIRGMDLRLGYGDTTRGASGESRALVKDSGSVLAINYGADFKGGTRVDSKLFVTNTTGAADPANDKVLTIGTNGEVKNSGNTLSQIASSSEPWMVQGGNTPATANNQNIYQSGSVMANGGALQTSFNSPEGGRVQILNSTKTASKIHDWSIYNMTGGYGDGLTFWRYAADGTNVGPAVTFADNGNVGIGVTKPAEKLDLAGNIQLSAGAKITAPGRLHITGDEALYLLNKNGVIVSKSWGGDGSLSVEGQTKLYDVPAGDASQPILTKAADGTVSQIAAGAISSASEPWYVAGTTTPATANNQNIYQSGNVGIGLNNPTSSLHVVGSVAPVAQFQTSVADAAIRIIPNGNMNGRFAILSNDTNKLTSLLGFNEGNAVGTITIKHDTGNIGIGGAPGIARMTVSGGTADISYGAFGSNTLTRNNAGLQGDAGARSGFYETSQAEAAGSNYPVGANGWWHMIDTRHSNNSNNYAMQIAGSFYDQNLWFRKTNTNAAQPWSKVLTQNQSTGALSIFNNLPVANGGNVLTMDGSGNVTQTPISSIVTQPVNIYNTNGTVTDNRDINQNGKWVNFFGGTFLAGGSNLVNGTLELSQQNAGDRSTFIDFHSAQAAWTGDYEARIIRTPGTNGNFEITNTGSGLIRLTNNSQVTGDLTVTGTIYQTSDIKFKKDIQSLRNGLTTISALRPVSYRWNDAGVKHGGEAGKEQIGFIAQEVEKVLPGAVQTDKDGNKSVNYSQVIPVLTQSVQELKKENEELKARLDKIEAKLNSKK